MDPSNVMDSSGPLAIRRISVIVTASRVDHSYFHRDAERLALLFEAYPFNDLDLRADPDDADIILFVGSNDRALVDVRTHPLYREYGSKCLAYHSGDDLLPTVPGIYASVPAKWYDERVHRAGFYLRNALDRYIADCSEIEAELLFSFIGAGSNHRVRLDVLALQDSEAELVDSGAHPLPPPLARERFAQSLRRSQFVLCPRGGGTSSFRIFEAMQAGRVPVVISDDWVEPDGPDWSAFSVRIPEREVKAIPGVLRKLRASAPQMGRAARSAWESWFSGPAAGATIIHWLSEIRREVSLNEYRMPPKMAWRYLKRRAMVCYRDLVTISNA